MLMMNKRGNNKTGTGNKTGSKKGQGLPLNTIIIAILVIVVLVVVIVFFLGGFAGLSQKVKIIFFGATAGVDKTLAVQNCQTWCDQAKILPVSLRKTSAYCDQYQFVDMNNDGEVEKEGDVTKKFFCSEGVPGISKSPGKPTGDLGVGCKDDDGKDVCPLTQQGSQSLAGFK